MIQFENLTEEGKELVRKLVKSKVEIPYKASLEDYLKECLKG
jgi:hypothetical protein